MMNSDFLERIAYCVEYGKVSLQSPYPPDMKGQDGADEITRKALDEGTAPGLILSEGLVKGMERIGVKFRAKQVFVPHVLMSAKAMNTAMEHLKPYFLSGAVQRKGTVLIGTVAGDLHDIGKNIVAMMIEGGGWEVINLGVDVKDEELIEEINKHPGCIVALSALLTTTMVNMENTVRKIKINNPNTRIMIGGAPVTREFCDEIGADFYSPDPQGVVEYLKTII
ncbi:MAG: corrinoid protein [Bacteroidales bacterium]|nr:corrinoid protein [Bacteroidales bacterium]